jgi:predicted DNA binding CopG/RHH family protein
MKNRIPKFKNEDEEREFWATHDLTDFFDLSKAKRAVFPNLRPSLRSISIRLPESMIEALRVLANKRDVPYQSLVKIFLSERIATEFRMQGDSLSRASFVHDSPRRSRKMG